MADKIEIIKVPRTDADVDNSYYVAKVPYEVEDDFGNKGTFFKKENIESKEQLLQTKASLEKMLLIVDEKIKTIEDLDKKG